MENIEKKYVLDEYALKAKCIDFLLSNHAGSFDDYVLVNELQFADGKRRADIVEVNGSMNVFEIKSDLDSLSRLAEQVYDYQICFDTVTVVTTEKHLYNVRKLLPKGIGLLLACRDDIVQIRKAACYRRFNKYALASFILNDDLNSLFRSLDIVGYSRMTTTQKRKCLSKLLPQDDLRSSAINSIKKRYKNSFLGFLQNRGKETLSDDIPLFWHGFIG